MGAGRMVKELHQIIEQVFQSDRRRSRANPARWRQDRQVVDHIAHHFESGGAGADDNSRPQFGDRYGGFPQNVGGDLPGAQMIRLFSFRRLQGAEKNQLPDRRDAQGIANVDRDPTFVRNKIAAFAHPVHQIINGIHLRQQGGKPLRLVKIERMAAYARKIEFLQPVDMACRRQHRVTLLA